MRISDWSSDVCSSDLAADELAILDADIQLRRDVGAHTEEDVELVDGGDIAVGLAVARVQNDPGSAMEGDAARRYRDKAAADLTRGHSGGDHPAVRCQVILSYEHKRLRWGKIMLKK